MALTTEQKQHVTWLLKKGNKLQAVKYFKETLNIGLKEAHALTEKLQEEIGLAANPHERMTLQSGRNMGHWVGLGFMSIGIIMLASVTYMVVSNNKFEKIAVHVKGKVIDFTSHESSDDDGGSTTMYAPVFEYQFNGQTYQYTSSTSSSSPEYDVGEEVEVLVDPKNPNEVLINTFWEKWFLSLVLGIMGVMFTGMGFMAYRLMG
jgi:hypothetical protein